MPQTFFLACAERLGLPGSARTLSARGRTCGSRFQEYKKAFKGELLANQYGRLVNLYMEKVARRRTR